MTTGEPGTVKEFQARIYEIEKHLSVILRERRESIGWSRREVVEDRLPRVGVELHEGTLGVYERLVTAKGPDTERRLSLRRLLEVATAYEVTASGMLREAEDRAGIRRCKHCGHESPLPIHYL